MSDPPLIAARSAENSSEGLRSFGERLIVGSDLSFSGGTQANGLWSAFDRLEFSSASVFDGEFVAIMLLKRDVGLPLHTEGSAIVPNGRGEKEYGREGSGGSDKENEKGREGGQGTYFIKCLCFADVSLAVTGDIRLSVGETMLRATTEGSGRADGRGERPKGEGEEREDSECDGPRRERACGRVASAKRARSECEGSEPARKERTSEERVSERITEPIDVMNQQGKKQNSSVKPSICNARD